MAKKNTNEIYEDLRAIHEQYKNIDNEEINIVKEYKYLIFQYKEMNKILLKFLCQK